MTALPKAGFQIPLYLSEHKGGAAVHFSMPQRSVPKNSAQGKAV
jgi:hypothetical protein